MTLVYGDDMFIGTDAGEMYISQAKNDLGQSECAKFVVK